MELPVTLLTYLSTILVTLEGGVIDRSSVQLDRAAQCSMVTLDVWDGELPSPLRYEPLKICSKVFIVSITICEKDREYANEFTWDLCFLPLLEKSQNHACVEKIIWNKYCYVVLNALHHGLCTLTQ